MWKESALWRTKYIAMEKQAKGASAAYMSNLNTAAPTATTSTPSTASTAPSAALTAELSELRAEKESWRQQKSAMDARLQAMEKQARSANDAFLASDGRGKEEAMQQVERLKAEAKALRSDNEQLKTQLEDFQLVMGDTRKKKL